MPEQVNCVLAQLNPRLLDKKANLERALSAIEEASRGGADLLVFPELFLAGYYMRERTKSEAEPLEGLSLSRLARSAKEHHTVVVVGFPELDGEAVYNSAAVIDADGRILGAHRKAHLYGVEPEYFVAGDRFQVFDTTVGRIGIQICFDVEFPETARLLALSGARILISASANMKPFEAYQDVYLRARAMENQIFHVLVNRVGKEEDTDFFGHSGVSDPSGNLVVDAGEQEGLFYGSIKTFLIHEATSALNYLDNRRPELYGGLTRESLSQ